MPKAVRAVEEILREERGNVAIHCHSYDHQKTLFENLPEDLRQRLIIHTRRDREERLREWMQSRGKVFVSVAFNEGQDWKYDVCDAQILLKVPFPDLGDKRVKKRLDMGHQQWYNNQAMLEVIQAYGRAVRAEDDKARFYVIDGSFPRLVGKCWQFVPDWFKDALPESFVPGSQTRET
jgi:Rad3-related DNA helicase